MEHTFDNGGGGGAVLMGSTSRGYAMDFGDIFQKSARSSVVSSCGDNNRDEELSRPAHPSLRRGTKEWQLPHYNTIAENATYLNHQLEMQQFGIHDAYTQLNFSTSPTDADLRRLMDCVHWLLHSRREEMHKSDEMAEQFVRYEKEIQRKNNLIQSLTLQLESERKSCTELENQMHAKDAAITKERALYKDEKRALERKCIQLQHVDTNYKAQLRKGEVAYERLQKQYNAYLNKPTKEKRGMILGKELNGKFDCAKNRTSNQGKTAGEHNIINTMIRSYETQHLQLLHENDTLRAHLTQFHGELKQLMQEYRSAAKCFLNRWVGASWRHGNATPELELQLQLPVDDGQGMKNAFTMPLLASDNNAGNKNNVLTMIQDQLGLLQSKIAALMDASQAQERHVLETRLADAIRVIQEQDQLIQVALRQASADDVDSRMERLELSGLEDMIESLTTERQEVAIQAEHMDAERQLFTQQAEQLDKDRLDFEFQRQDALSHGHNEFVRHDAKKRLRMDTSNVSPSAEWSGSPHLLAMGPALHVPPTPATARLLEKIGIDNDHIMSPIASASTSSGGPFY
ncbi:Aste57867_23510 [Aphanomyces stellatus]|uniref:Aste57867_23510 protein n=1 Tax=Aphanomyces stellatus TaxID=120398 RepID=A0A485LMW1_9STRA|nr:hypothetical protein As57867_023439 [Aphanomyces stellatus]VFU00155.1 Aste57867_23510 [Aphanomyces stellatus]